VGCPPRTGPFLILRAPDRLRRREERDRWDRNAIVRSSSKRWSRSCSRGAKRPGQLCREHAIDISTLRQWREQYAQWGVAAGSAVAVKAATAQEDKIAELERIVGQLTVENMVLKRALQRAQCPSPSRTPSLRS